MGIEERMKSFFYEKIPGWVGSKSVYRLKKFGEVENDLPHQKETCFIKDFDFTNLPPSEQELLKELKWFQETENYVMETSRLSLKIPIKWLEEILSNTSIGQEGELY